jgi:hypothetical protein
VARTQFSPAFNWQAGSQPLHSKPVQLGTFSMVGIDAERIYQIGRWSALGWLEYFGRSRLYLGSLLLESTLLLRSQSSNCFNFSFLSRFRIVKLHFQRFLAVIIVRLWQLRLILQDYRNKREVAVVRLHAHMSDCLQSHFPRPGSYGMWYSRFMECCEPCRERVAPRSPCFIDITRTMSALLLYHFQL